ncbi:hypothetical protein [Aeromonas caviae]|uniref:hypothetical protein n=1 Tax=Aeromonas caviae TaxID=648 RepID=UPI0029DC84C6|nr:hypothetical protein [Aeromonas caviae]MDX7786015.1 hypothetical protein [Aeromonas caviae]
MPSPKIKYDTPTLDTYYDFVSIIDGLNVSDRSSFRISQEINSLLTHEELPTRLINVNSKAEFESELKELLAIAKSGKKFLIHVVAHGNKQGVEAGSEFISWSDITSYLQDINEETDNSLLLNMSTCKGLFGAWTVPKQGRYPFFGIIGSKEDLSVDDALNANKIMYKKWLLNVPVEKMVPETNADLGREILFNLSAEGFRKLVLENK